MPATNFPMPPRATPRPLDAWLTDTDRAEQGREPFFSGRTEAFKLFQEVAGKLADGKVGGDTSVIQGAPGAGKTALMLECAEAVRRHSTYKNPWVAVSLKSALLASASDTLREIILRAEEENTRLADRVSSTKRMLDKAAGALAKVRKEAFERGFTALGAQIGGRTARPRTAAGLFSEAAPALKGFHIIVFVDEAQNIHVKEETKDVIETLHLGTDGIALLPVFFGLSDTTHVLAQCGLSRLGDERVRELQPMSPEESKASIAAVFDAYGFGVPGPERDRWLEVLAEESQGWPQHINRLAVAAGRVLRDNELRLDDSALEQAVVAGKQRKNNYYEQRLGVAMSHHGLYKRLALAAAKSDGGVLPKSDIERLAEPTLVKHGVDIDTFLSASLHAGVLSPTTAGGYAYRFPIPSFAQYLRDLPVEPSVQPDQGTIMAERPRFKIRKPRRKFHKAGDRKTAKENKPLSPARTQAGRNPTFRTAR